MRSNRVAALLVAAVVILPATGCGIRGEQKKQDFILQSGNRAARKGTAKFTVSITSTRKATKLKVPRPILAPNPIKLEGVVNFKKYEAAIGEPGKEPIVIWDDTVVLVRRHKRGTGSSDPRNWARLDLTARKADSYDVKGGLGFLWINPAYMIRLVDGALTGSLKGPFAETVDGSQLKRYDANFDKEKATRGNGEKKIKALNIALAEMGSRGPSFRASVWLDDAGVAKRFTMHLEQRIDIDNTILGDYTMDLRDLGTPVTITIPPKSDGFTVRNLVQLIVQVDIPEGA